MGGEPRGGVTPFGICPQERIAETGSLVAQGFCNTKDCPPALALRDRSQQSASVAKTRVLDSLCVFCASEPPHSFNFFILLNSVPAVERCQRETAPICGSLTQHLTVTH